MDHGPRSHRPRLVAHAGLALLAAAVAGAVALVATGHAASAASGALAALVVAHVVVLALVAAVFLAARAHRSARRGNDGRGLTLHAPVAYDFLAALYTLGREGRMRERTLDLAQLKAGDRLLDVCSGTGTLALA